MKYRDENGNWQDIYLKPSGDTLPIGSIVDFAGDTAPYGWLICDGSLLAISSYPELYNVIGTSFTLPTDVEGYFRLPNKKGRVSIGVDNNDTDFDTIGNTYGEKNHKMTIDELVTHSHIQNVTSGSTGPAIRNDYNEDDNGLPYNQGISTGDTGNTKPFNIVQPSIVFNSIIKVKQSVGIVGKVANEENEEEDVVYSAKYIEENFVRIT